MSIGTPSPRDQRLIVLITFLTLDLALLAARVLETLVGDMPTPELNLAFSSAVTGTLAALAVYLHQGVNK